MDLNGGKFFRQQARMMVASLERSGFKGDIKIIHNGDTEIFDHPHPKVEEIGVEAPETTAECYRVKFRARNLFSVEGYDWVLFLDADFIVSSSLDSWFTGPEIIRYATEPGFEIHYPQFSAFLSEEEMRTLKQAGINSGAFVIKAEHFHDVMALWEEIDAGETTRCKAGDQHAWNRLLLDTQLPIRILADPEVNYYYRNANFIEMLKAQVLHYCGCYGGERILAMQAKFVSHFHPDGDGTLIRLLER
jgi:lipopolysaccharide biosynthesis glycosyltransferase